MPSTIQKIKKRNGDIVDFDLAKISTAMRKAFASQDKELSDADLDALTTQISGHLDEYFVEKTPSVENVQDIVEMVLMSGNHFEVAKAYILYRYEHLKSREREHQVISEKIDQDALQITKRSGETTTFSMEKFVDSMKWATQGYEDIIDLDSIAQNCRNNLYDNITTAEISQAAILSARGWIERDPAYAHFASRLLLEVLYHEVVGTETYDYKNLDALYRKAFVDNIKRAVEIDRLDESLLQYDLEEMASHLKIERDDLFRYLGMQTLYDRYFIRNPENKRVLESPQGFWMRIAMGLAIDEENRVEKALEFYEVMSTLRYVPSTPTLFHSGTNHPQLSSCYLTTIDDSLSHIFKCVGDNAQLSKWSGGLGNDWTNIRGTGSLIHGTGVESQGVVPFLKIANDTTVAINRSGRRRGATCAYLETWHYDIEDFLELRRNTGDERRRTHDMNTANWIPDLFMKRVRDDQMWTLFSPDETPDLHHIYGKKFEERYAEYEQMVEEGKIRVFKKMRAKDLWRKMVTMLFETGHPWITFKDPCNVRSPQDHVGVVHSSNLCTEITLNTSAEETAVCNLGSVNMKLHVKDKQLDKELIKQTVTTAMRMLDNVIDLNFYPTKEAKFSNMKHRPVGLGIMGFQDALYLMGIPFESEEAIQFADESMEVVSYYAILTSSQLAGERGAYETFEGSKWDRGLLPLDTLGLLEEERGESIPVDRSMKMDWTEVRESIKANGMRNSNTMAVAPTATISNIAGSFPTIEPIYKNMYVKSNMSGEFTITNAYLIDALKARGLWNEEMLQNIKRHDGSIGEIEELPADIRLMYKEVFDIDPQILIRVAAHRGKWIDQSQSLNLFMKGTSGKIISNMYHYAWSLGLKTTYYLRSMAASHVEKSTLDLKKAQDSEPKKVPVEAPAAVSASEPKLCKINDPECEACQ